MFYYLTFFVLMCAFFVILDNYYITFYFICTLFFFLKFLKVKNSQKLKERKLLKNQCKCYKCQYCDTLTTTDTSHIVSRKINQKKFDEVQKLIKESNERDIKRKKGRQNRFEKRAEKKAEKSAKILAKANEQIEFINKKFGL